MHDIVKEFNDIRQNNDLFQSWQDETGLRNRMRICAASEVALSDVDHDTVDFLYRSLYWHNRPHFFYILFTNMNNLVIYKWLNSNPNLARAFLAWLPYQILQTQPDFRQVQFLINIYHTDYHAEIIRIVNVLGTSVCEELLKRTGRPVFRTLLRERLIKLQKQQSRFDYDLKTIQRANTSYTALFGDKMQLLVRAASILKKSRQDHSLETDYNKRFMLLAEAAGAVFEGGLIEDSLAILAEAYVNYLDNNRAVNLDEETALHHLLYRSLRRIIPVHALLYEPSAPFLSALSIYRNWFALVSPEPASLEFLKLYETIQEGMTRPGQNIMAEVGYRAAVIKNYRPDDLFLTGLPDWGQGSAAMAEKIHQTARERMQALPHEAFIILEFLRLAEKCYPGTSNGLNLLNDYMELWKWVPLPLFLNQDMVKELGPGSDIRTRRQAERIIQTESPGRPNSDFMDLFARVYKGVF